MSEVTAQLPEDRPSLLGLDRSELSTLLAEVIDRPFRIEQIFRALHVRRVSSFDEMTDLSLDLRERMAASFSIGRPEVDERQTSRDGTSKLLFRLADGATIEAVDIPDGGRRTLCVSCQAGCALACAFCVTGYWGAGRDLTAAEIVGQVHAVQSGPVPPGIAPNAGLNLVFMGMGEPMLNLEAVYRALVLLTETISWRRVTVSTAGVVPGIDAMAAWPRRPNLAISLHAPDDERRSRLMPINRKWPLAELLAAIRRYPLERGRLITFEYTLIRDFNDDPRDAARLECLLEGLPAKINLIPLNPDPVLGDLAPPPFGRVLEFQRALEARGIVAPVRRPRGEDVSAACGQLRAFGRQPRGPAAKVDAPAV